MSVIDCYLELPPALLHTLRQGRKKWQLVCAIRDIGTVTSVKGKIVGDNSRRHNRARQGQLISSGSVKPAKPVKAARPKGRPQRPVVSKPAPPKAQPKKAAPKVPPPKAPRKVAKSPAMMTLDVSLPSSLRRLKSDVMIKKVRASLKKKPASQKKATGS